MKISRKVVAVILCFVLLTAGTTYIVTSKLNKKTTSTAAKAAAPA